MPRSVPKQILKGIYALLCLLGAVALVRDTAYQGQDFSVFWRAARAVIDGQPVYDLARDGAMVFKYPPWFVPVFLPFAAFDLTTAKWLWGIVQVACLFYVQRWVLANIACSGMAHALLLASWGIWAVHAMDGQVNLLVLAFVLFLWAKRNRSSDIGILGLLSGKVFTLFGAVGRPSTWNPKSLLAAAGVAALLSLPALWVQPSMEIPGLVSSWRSAAASGGERFDPGKIRGRDNQGFPALVLRKLEVSATETRADFLAFCFFSVAIGILAWLVRSCLSPPETAVLWLGLTAAVHPLAWFHVFAFAYPLLVLAADRAWIHGRTFERLLVGVGGLFLVGVTRKTFGDLGVELELLSIKAVGVVLCSIALVSSKRKVRSAVRA